LKKLRCDSQWMRLVVSYGKASVALDSNYYACPSRSYTTRGFSAIFRHLFGGKFDSILG
jgi:hypothetical protein